MILITEHNTLLVRSLEEINHLGVRPSTFLGSDLLLSSNNINVKVTKRIN